MDGSLQVTPTRPRSGLWCLVAVARHHGLDLSEEKLVHTHALGDRDLDVARLIRIAREHRLTAKVVALDWDGLFALGEALPAILPLKDGSFVILSGVRNDRGKPEVVVRNPMALQGGFDFWDRATLGLVWSGSVVLTKRRFQLADADRPFGLAWFLPEILRQKRAFADIVVAALVLHLIGLTTPLFFQIVIDKVVVHQAYATLTALGAGVLAAIAFEAVLGFLRQYLLLHCTMKIDVRVTTMVFRHLLSLPMEYFERSSAGVLINHVQQDRTIREFLTGRLFSSLLDASALVVFLPILFFYSPVLACIVLGFALLMGGIITVVARIFRVRLQELYKAEAGRQALLVETIHGIGTVKALTLEPMQQRQWDGRSADAVERHMSVGKLSSVARTLSTALEKLMTVAVIWVGIEFVFSGDLSIGELVAFQMLSGRVSGPLMQLIGLINDYQQTAVSVRMLGEVMNSPPEQGLSRGLQPMLAGGITFESVSFRYPTGTAAALDRISLDLRPGSILGIVGRSGSGKTTFIRLLQGLHTARAGVIRLDGIDLREIDKTHLRRQIGVVPQETFLFRGSVRDNISISRPDARFEDIVRAAQLAGADEFIQRLPQGYDTELEEGAVNLSGGQKQRLAIARALLRNPVILIFDEATSALDPESEMIVQRNLKAIARGRTLVIVSHRLTSLRHADAILVLNEGKMVGFDRHDGLLQSCPPYRQLWQLQTEALR